MISEAERKLNETARFLPQVDDDTLPCLVVGGVQVYAYFKGGELVVGVNYDTAEDCVVDVDGCVPTRVFLGGAEVHYEP